MRVEKPIPGDHDAKMTVPVALHAKPKRNDRGARSRHQREGYDVRGRTKKLLFGKAHNRSAPWDRG